MTMTNAEWMIKQGKNFSELTCRVNFVTDKFEICLDSKIIGEIGISTISRNAILVWLDMEHVEPILDDAERRYLSAVIKPFRNDVTEIRKRSCKPYEYLRINGRFNNGVNYFFLPNFDAGTMYKGMDPDRWYTLEELGL